MLSCIQHVTSVCALVTMCMTYIAKQGKTRYCIPLHNAGWLSKLAGASLEQSALNNLPPNNDSATVLPHTQLASKEGRCQASLKRKMITLGCKALYQDIKVGWRGSVTEQHKHDAGSPSLTKQHNHNTKQQVWAPSSTYQQQQLQCSHHRC